MWILKWHILIYEYVCCAYVYAYRSVCLCICMCMCMCHSIHAEVRRQFAQVSSFRPPCRSQGSNSGPQASPAWWESPSFILLASSLFPVSIFVELFLLVGAHVFLYDTQVTVCEISSHMSRKEILHGKVKETRTNHLKMYHAGLSAVSGWNSQRNCSHRKVHSACLSQEQQAIKILSHMKAGGR